MYFWTLASSGFSDVEPAPFLCNIKKKKKKKMIIGELPIYCKGLRKRKD